MSKAIPINTRGFGSEPGEPDISSLTEWVASHRGISADLILFEIDTLLSLQLAAGIATPCAGGCFYRDRIRDSLVGLDNKKETAIAEIHVEPELIAHDAFFLSSIKKETWFAFPAPLSLGITNRNYSDNEEWVEAITAAYRILMRSMRDAGTPGNVMICSTIDDQEISTLAGKNTFFFKPDPSLTDLKIILENQRRVAVPADILTKAFTLADEYPVQQWILMNPDRKSIEYALSHADPDQIVIGGYCKGDCDTYWGELKANAVYYK